LIGGTFHAFPFVTMKRSWNSWSARSTIRSPSQAEPPAVPVSDDGPLGADPSERLLEAVLELSEERRILRTEA